MFDDGARWSRGLAVVSAVLVLAAFGGALVLMALGTLEASGAWGGVLADRDYLDRLWFSLGQAAAATVVGLTLGLPASWFLSRGGLPLRGALVLLVTAPLAIPGVVVGLGIDLIAGGEVEPRALVILAHAVFATAAVTWLVSPAWNAGSHAATEDARLLGASGVRAYLAGSGRQVPGAVRAAGALAFWYAFAAAGTVAILGGTEGGTTESVLAFGEGVSATRPALDDALTSQQSVVALVQVLVGLAVLALGGTRWPRAGGVSSRRRGRVIALGVTYLVLLAAALWAPLALVAGKAASEDALSGLLDASVGGYGVGALLAWTAGLGALSALVATGLAALAVPLVAPRIERPRIERSSLEGRRALLGWLAVLPVALSSAALGWAGLVLADRAGMDLDQTYLLTVVAHALIAYPFALRILATRGVVQHVLMEDAALLGASPRAVRWRWAGRRTAMALASTFLIAAVLSAGEVAAASLLTPDEATPAALGLLRGWQGHGETEGAVYTLGTALAVATVVGFAGAEWLRRAAVQREGRVEA